MIDDFEKLKAKLNAKISEFESSKHIQDIDGLKVFHGLKTAFEQLHLELSFFSTAEDSEELKELTAKANAYILAARDKLGICDGVRPKSVDDSLPAANSMFIRFFGVLGYSSASPDEKHAASPSPING